MHIYRARKKYKLKLKGWLGGRQTSILNIGTRDLQLTSNEIHAFKKM